jgi:hypothetical protein
VNKPADTNFQVLRAHTLSSEIYGIPCQYVNLPTLIRTKRAAGRPKDLEAIAELEAIWEDNR